MSGSLSSRFDSCGGRTTGFDCLRIGLALSVFFWHVPLVTIGPAPLDWLNGTPLRIIATVILPMFFALSGYLVAASLERCRTVVYFLFLRAIRIFPALIVEVLLSAILLGALFTTLPLGEYFTHDTFLRYLMNAVGSITYQLPGVFESNVHAGIVNAQLWTVPWELECYIAIAILGVFGAYRHPAVALMGLAAIVLISLAEYTQMDPSGEPVTGRMLVRYTLCGMFLARFRDRIPFDGRLFQVCLALVIGIGSTPGGGYLILLPLTYATIYIGLLNPRLPRLLNASDYSYGIFLYHFAIQQAVVAGFAWGADPLLNVLVSLPLTLLFAMFSWHVVEKPMLAVRPYGRTAETRLIELHQWLRSFRRRGRGAGAKQMKPVATSS